MKLDAQVLHSPAGQAAVVGIILLLGVTAVRCQHRPPTPLPAATPTPAVSLPKTFTRDGAKFSVTPGAARAGSVRPNGREMARPAEKPRTAPLSLFAAPPAPAPVSAGWGAPYGRMIPCETVVAIESNRLETPIVGLVTEDVWHAGRLVVPAGAEVHGKVALDRTRERLAAQGNWRIVWRTKDPDNGTEVAVEGLALDREFNGSAGLWGEHDGSAGLRGDVIRTTGDQEIKLFAATFLSTAAAALQDTRGVPGMFGELAVPAATARNATLAGSAAVLSEYARELREAIARDGFYLRVPAGKPFYLYVTQALDRGESPPSAGAATHPSRE